MKNENNDQLYNLHLKRTRERINKEQNLFMEVLKDNLINKPHDGQTKEEKIENKKRLLNFVHRYVFLQRLQPLDSNVDKINRVVVESYRIKKFVKYYLFIRNFFGNFFKLRALFIILSAILFFFLEFFGHYFLLFSLNDINVTFQDIINKIPPFF
jgi:hypothetical protein